MRNRKRREKIMQIHMRRYGEDGFRSQGNSFRIQIQKILLDKSFGFDCYMDAIENVLEEFSNTGVFSWKLLGWRDIEEIFFFNISKWRGTGLWFCSVSFNWNIWLRQPAIAFPLMNFQHFAYVYDIEAHSISSIS